MPLSDLLADAQRTHGLFTLSQASRHGVSRRSLQCLAGSGVVELLGNCVYRVSGSVDSWRQRALAGVLTTGPQALASHRTAAALWELPHATGRSVEVLVPHGTGARPKAARRHETRHLTGMDVDLRDGIPATSIERTIIDLASVLRMGPLARLLDDAHGLELSTYGRVRRHLATMPTRGRTGVRVLRLLLAERIGSDRDGSRTFENMMNALLRRSGLPAPVRQQEVRSGEQRLYLDFAWPRYKVAVECDGLCAHGSPAAMAYDLARQNEIIDQGWNLRRFTWSDVQLRPDQTVDTVRRALLAGDWRPSSSAG